MLRFLNWRALFRRRKFESEMAEEFAFHVEARIDDLVRAGVAPDEAKRRARLEFGGNERYRVECRESHRLHWLDEFARNVRYAIRNLWKAPTFSLAAILSLALGLGINTFVFSVFDSLILRPLPIADPARVAFVETSNIGTLSFPDYKEFRDSNTTFNGLAGFRISVVNFEHGGEPTRMWGYLATGNYFDVLGVKPAVGRLFHQSDDLQPGASPYAVLSYPCWQTRFAGDANIAGHTVRINGLNYTVLGVAPRDFHGTELFYWPEVWIPMMMQAQIEPGDSWLNERSTWDTMIFGRLKRQVTRSQATADLNRIAEGLARRFPQNDKGLAMRLTELGFMGSRLRVPVKAFTAGVLLLAGLVLLTACSNLAGLMLARVTDRQRELAIRYSIGAGRARIVSQLLTESFVLAVLGGTVGCVLAVVACKLFSSWHAPIDFPIQISVATDWRMLAFASAATLATTFLFGLGPALRSSRTDLNPLLKGNSGMAIFKTRHRFALRDLLLVAQVAFSFVLVFGCILSLRGLQHALNLPIGFEPRDVVIGSVDLGLAGYSEARGKEFQRQMAANLRALPDVASVAFANSLPLSIDQSSTSAERTDMPSDLGRRERRQANYYEISPGLLHTLGVPFLLGRDFNEHDSEHAARVAVVNQTFAREILKTDNPIGKTFRYGPKSPAIQVIGLVADGKYVSLTEDPDPVIFRCIYQEYPSTTVFVIRSRNSAAAVAELRKQIASLDPRLPIYGVGSLESLLGFAMFPMHAAAIALSAFGLLALLLTLTGIYGLVDYSVARRTREIGIRIAVGAPVAELLRLMLGKLALLVAAGLCLGVVLAIAAGPALAAVIYMTSPRDPALLFGLLVALLVAAMLSSWKPVSRGLHVDPVRALRCE